MTPLVLIIEDNPLNLELATDLLEANGFRVIQGASAEEGVRLAFERLPHLILMDLSLPGMDGLEAARLLKDGPITSHIPIIALTAHAMRGDEASALANGCDGYLSKPIDTRAFVSAVTSFINAGRRHTSGPIVMTPQ